MLGNLNNIWFLNSVLAVTTLAGTAIRENQKRREIGGRLTAQCTNRRGGNGNVLGLALADIGAGATRLVDGDRVDLQGCSTRPSATASSTMQVRKKSSLTVCMILL